MLSMTRLSTGPLLGSSLRPSCSWSAVNIEGGPVGSEAGGGPLNAANVVPSLENSTRMSNRPVMPVLLILDGPIPRGDSWRIHRVSRLEIASRWAMTG